MKNSQPSALQMPKDRKAETVEAVYQALSIINERHKSRRWHWEETWKITKRFHKHTIKMFRDSNRGLSVWVSLIVGSSQQRRIKRYIRQTDIRRESYRIAQATGADFGEVKERYFEMMDHYVENEL